MIKKSKKRLKAKTIGWIILVIFIVLYILFSLLRLSIIHFKSPDEGKLCFKQSDCKQSFFTNTYCDLIKNESGNLTGECLSGKGCFTTLEDDGNISKICID